MKKLRVALFGWFGNGALADDLIGYVTKKELEKLNCSVVLGGWKTGIDLIKQLKTFDILMFGGGSLLCPTKIYPINMIREWYPKVNKPFYLFGTGFRKETPTLSIDQIKLNQYLFSVLKESWPRGKITIQELNNNAISKEHYGYGDPGILFTKTHNIDQDYQKPLLGIVARNIPEKEKCFVPNKIVHKIFIIVT